MSKLTEEQRVELGKKAAQERYHPSTPRATHSGILQIGDKKIECSVLKMPDGSIKRVISTRSIERLLGKARPDARSREISRVCGVPTFLAANNIKQFIPIEKMGVCAPIIYKNRHGCSISGYEYEILILACDCYLQARVADELTRDQTDLAKSCEVLVRSFAQVGLVSLIDEVSGYQEVRDRLALQAILDNHLRKEFAAWSKKFPDSFYREIFRLNNWKFQEIANRRPQIIGKYTNDIVYSRLLPELVDELERINPKDEIGRRVATHHQWLNEIGNADLASHITGVTAVMKACSDWKQFKELLDRAFPVKSSKDILIKSDT